MIKALAVRGMSDANVGRMLMNFFFFFKFEILLNTTHYAGIIDQSIRRSIYIFLIYFKYVQLIISEEVS